MIIKARKDITEKGLIKEMNKISPQEIIKQIKEELQEMDIKKMLSINSFIKYLISEEKEKKFLTPKDSIIAKNKETLEKNHNCKIIILSEEQEEKIKKIQGVDKRKW